MGPLWSHGCLEVGLSFAQLEHANVKSSYSPCTSDMLESLINNQLIYITKISVVYSIYNALPLHAFMHNQL